MRSSAAPHLRRPVARPRRIRRLVRGQSYLRAVPPAPAFSPGPALRQRLALWGVGGVGLLTGAVIGLFWNPAAAGLAMLVAALMCRAERR